MKNLKDFLFGPAWPRFWNPDSGFAGGILFIITCGLAGFIISEAVKVFQP